MSMQKFGDRQPLRVEEDDNPNATPERVSLDEQIARIDELLNEGSEED